MTAEKKPEKASKVPVATKKKKKLEPMKITPALVKKAKKAELSSYCKELGLSEEGHVDELRQRLLNHLEEEKAKAPSKKKTRKETEEQEVEIEEEGAYMPKQKPSLSDQTKEDLLLRDKISTRRPEFRRQEWFRYKRLGDKWRKPQGLHSKLRRHFRYRINVVSVGYRGPVRTRGLHSSGFREVLVYNPGQLKGIDPATQAVRIAHAVGMRKRKQIEEVAAEMGIRVLNRSGEIES